MQQRDERELIEEIALAKLDAVLEVGDPLEVIAGCPAHHAIDGVAFLEKKLREVRAVLSGDAGDERPPLCHGASLAERGLTR